MITKIHVRGRFEATRFDVPYRCAIISITDSGSDKPQFRQFCLMSEKHLLRLQFDDVDVSQYTAADLELFDCYPMSDYHAKQIPRFLRSIENEDLSALLIHCEAGISRSISTAMAICDALQWSRDVIDWKGRDVNAKPPNSHVYQCVWSAFQCTP